MLYFDYVRERHGHLGKGVVTAGEPTSAFAIYQLYEDENNVPYIEIKEMYVRPELRGSCLALDIIRQLECIGQENYCEFVITQIDLDSKGWEEALQFQIKQGSRPSHMKNKIMYLVKSLHPITPNFDFSVHKEDNPLWKEQMQTHLDNGCTIVKVDSKIIYFKKALHAVL